MLGMAMDRILIDPSVVRGLEYYTGPVFEAELTFEMLGEDGKPIRFGSVGGGGRYDGLVARFRAEPVPATGFSIGVSRLLAALRAIHSPIVAGGETGRPGRRRSCSTATTWPITSGSSRNCARRESRPNSISAPAASTPSSNTPTGAARSARSSRARTSATRRAGRRW